MADALESGSSEHKLVRVQLPPSAPGARLTQRKSAILTRWKSLVRIQHRAPFLFLENFLVLLPLLHPFDFAIDKRAHRFQNFKPRLGKVLPGFLVQERPKNPLHRSKEEFFKNCSHLFSLLLHASSPPLYVPFHQFLRFALVSYCLKIHHKSPRGFHLGHEPP